MKKGGQQGRLCVVYLEIQEQLAVLARISLV